MNELQTMGAIETTGIDGKGLAADIPDDQLDTAADQLGHLDDMAGLVAADLYIRKLKALGVVPGSHTKSSAGVGGAFPEEEINAYCKRLRKSRSRMESLAASARQWPRELVFDNAGVLISENTERVAGMTPAHYQAVASELERDDEGNIISRDKARAWLQKAQMGDPSTPINQAKPKGWKVLSAAKLRRQIEESKPQLDAPPPAEDEAPVIEAKNAILADVAKALGADTPKNRKVYGKVERGVDKAFDLMGEQYKTAMESEITRRVAFERQQHKVIQDQADEAKAAYESAIKGVARPIEMDELRILRQFCHPDKHPGNEAKAGQAYEIIDRIAKRLQLSGKKASNG